LAVTTYSALTNEQRTFYVARLIKRLLPFIPLQKDGEKTTVGRNTGTGVQWRKWGALALATSALTEGTPPTEMSLTITAVTATLAQYGAFVKISDLLIVAGIDPAMEQTNDLESEQAGRSIHTLIVNALASGTTVQYASTATTRLTVAAGMNFYMIEVRKAVRTLKKNNVMRFPDGYYHGSLTPSQWYDLRSDSSANTGMTWAQANTYVNTDNFQKGMLGAVEGVTFYETSTDNPVFTGAGAGGIDVHAAFIYGQGGYGTVDLTTQTVADIDPLTNRGIDVMVVPANTPSKIDPLQQYGISGWKVAYVVQVLDALRMLRVETAVSG
jgi:N4-gp56 family major capsid protein